MLHLATHCTLVIRHLLPAPPRASPDKTSFPQRNHPPLARERNKNSAVRASRSQMAVERSEPSEERSDPPKESNETLHPTLPKAPALASRGYQNNRARRASLPRRAAPQTEPTETRHPLPSPATPALASRGYQNNRARRASLPRRAAPPAKRQAATCPAALFHPGSDPKTIPPFAARGQTSSRTMTPLPSRPHRTTKRLGQHGSPAPATAARQSTVTEQRDRMPTPRTCYFRCQKNGSFY